MTTQERQDAREREVLDKVRQDRRVSFWWLTIPATRFEALNRLEKRGVVTVKNDGYPMYRVTICKGGKRGKG